MIEAMRLAFEAEGFWLLGLIAFVAGCVRGFAGFGTALVYLPVAGQVLSPVAALTTLIIFELIGPLPHIPGALRQGHVRDVLRLTLGAVVALPFGVMILVVLAPETFRVTVSVLSLLMLAALLSGLRYRGALTRPLVYGTGALGGFLSGSVGLPGPPVVMLYMASARAVEVVRANLLLYLILTDALTLLVLGGQGHFDGAAFALGLALVPLNLLGNLLGAALFRPERERAYKTIAYVIIAGSAVSGLPIFP